MTNNYCESSSWMDIPEGKLKEAAEICDRISTELEKDRNEGYCGVEFEIRSETSSIWFHEDDSINTEHLELIARALVEELDLPPFFCSWAYTCSKPRVNEFGGGAFAIIRGKDHQGGICFRWSLTFIRKDYEMTKEDERKGYVRVVVFSDYI